MSFPIPDSQASLEARILELESALRAARQECARLYAVLEGTDETVMIRSLEGRVIYANPASIRAIGKPADAIVGKLDTEVFARQDGGPDFVPDVKRTDAVVLETGSALTYELLREGPNGVELAFISNKFPVRDPETGAIEALAALTRDVTAGRQAEAALRESETRFKGLLAAAFDGFSLHQDDRILDANDALARMLGYEDASALIGRTWWEFIAPECHEAVRRAMAEELEKPYEIAGLHRDGHRVPVEVVGRTVMHGGRPARVAAYRDISERKRHEQELESRNAKLQIVDNLKNAFVGSVSHELRTPLTGIQGYTEFLEDELGGPLTDRQRDYVHQIQAGTTRMIRLVDDLLDFARLESGTFELTLSEVDLGQLLLETQKALLPTFERQHVSLRIEAGASATLLADQGRLQQVLTNLIGNALKFTPAQGVVTVSLTQEGDAWKIAVSDTGLGIPPEHLPHLFERFYQVDRSMTRKVGGAGLGLAISKALVEAHGGRLGVASTPGVGSTFWFTLPRPRPGEEAGA